ncbi:MAG: hypothetical protein FJX48_06460 [Alphaproteobacteria bacterium]|nr:hypothetical protein [Alphaproteobacteria bacterium]
MVAVTASAVAKISSEQQFQNVESAEIELSDQGVERDIHGADQGHIAKQDDRNRERHVKQVVQCEASTRALRRVLSGRLQVHRVILPEKTSSWSIFTQYPPA